VREVGRGNGMEERFKTLVGGGEFKRWND